MNVVNPHTIMAIANERIADLHRYAAPRPGASPEARRTRRLNGSANRTQTASAARAEQS